MRHERRLAVLALMLCPALPAAAQGFGGPHMMGMGPPGFMRQLFLPRIVMAHQGEIGLTPAQRQAITDDMAATEKKTLDLRWSVEQKSEELDKLLAADKIDEAAVLARSGEILDVEKQIKQAHLGLLVRLKNQLTPAQRAKLEELRPRALGPRERGRFGRRPFGSGPPPGAEE